MALEAGLTAEQLRLVLGEQFVRLIEHEAAVDAGPAPGPRTEALDEAPSRGRLGLDMSSRPLLIAGIVAGALAGVALVAVALFIVAVDGATLSAQMMSMLVLGTMGLIALDGTWLTMAMRRLGKLSDGGENDDGEGWGRRGPAPARPSPPSGDPGWWPEFERELRTYQQERERSPTAD